jgi:cytidine deaminase
MGADLAPPDPIHATLIDTARALLNPLTLAREDMNAATVGCALRAANGTVYTGICIHLSCGLGFCAEAAAIADMIKDGQTDIVAIVAVTHDRILSPCGRCREMMIQVDQANGATEVILSQTRSVALATLLPAHWLSPSES